MSPRTLQLGSCDAAALPANADAFLRPYHEAAMTGSKLRGEKNGEWVALAPLPGTEVTALQASLREAGFLPGGATAGVFDYRTLSAARLFQEYVRTVEGLTDIGTPDGVVGPKTQAHLARWKAAAQRSRWSTSAPDRGTPLFRYWFRVINHYHGLNAVKPVSRALAKANAVTRASDTLKVGAWQLDPRATHILGIRRQEWRTDHQRRNDDLIILLINGLAFTFAGSTDPHPRSAERPDEAYLVPGQHRYRFGWHKQSDRTVVYRAFRPVSHGVLVARDHNNDDALTDADLERSLDVEPTINIHWSGTGTSNWSAGCQVIAGGRYGDDRGALVDCRPFSAARYADLGPKTRGAYNLFVDLITVFAPSNAVTAGATVFYTLLRQPELDLLVQGRRPLREIAATGLTDLQPDTIAVDGLVAALLSVR